MIRLTCPGKVFLLGEYSVIVGGRSIVGAVGPLFELTAKTATKVQHSPIPFAPQSPAGLYLNQHKHLIENFNLQWIDPYQTAIGVGSSSAQFVLSMALVRHLQGETLISAQDVLETYWQTVGETQGLRPSGADVVAQFTGGFNLFRNEPFHCESLPKWSSEIGFVLAFTGSKAKTHEHLKQLQQKGFPQNYQQMLKDLDAITLRAIEYWRHHRINDFGFCLNEYQATLNEQIPIPSEYRRRTELIQQWPGVIAAKGSGAQGGDCILIMAQRDSLQSLHTRIRHWDWVPYDVEWSDTGAQVFGP